MSEHQNQLPPQAVNVLLHGDCLERLADLPADSVQCCITSPPYYGLRDYGTAEIVTFQPDCQHDWYTPQGPLAVPGVMLCRFCLGEKHDHQIGLEQTPEEYIEKLVQVFRQVRRVLRPDGTLWLNLGDSYTSGGRATHDPGRSTRHPAQPKGTTRPPTPAGLKPKDLIGLPWMLAFALRADGWYLRSDIIWHKPTAMPESVADRPTTAHEHVFLLAKSEHYFYDAQAICEPASEQTHSRGNGLHPKLAAVGSGIKSNASWAFAHRGRVATRNKRTVWTIASQPFSAADYGITNIDHYATFPPKLVEPCLLAGSSPKACECCGAPWERVLAPTGQLNRREAAHMPLNTPTKTDSSGWAPTRIATDRWRPTCNHENEGTGKCIVLDPFCGAGTVALVALQYGRHYLGIEINQDYIALAQRRIAQVQPVLWTGAAETEVSA